MNVSSQPIVLPISHHHRRILTTTPSPMFIDASPIAVSNKIKAIQARKTRLNFLPTECDYTDIRPVNFGYPGDVTNSKTNFTVWTAEKLVDRSKSIRLDRIATRRTPRASVLSTTSNNQQALLWPNYQPSTQGSKQPQTYSNSTTVTPPAINSIKNKPAGGQMPEIPRRHHRRPLIDRQNSPTAVQPAQKSSQISIINIPETMMKNNNTDNNLPTHEIEAVEDEELLIDKEFEQYLDQAIIKCADWLLKYVFTEKNN